MDNSIAGPSNYGVTEDVKSEFILGDPGETTHPTSASVDTSDLNSILDHLKVEEPQSEVGVIKNLVSFVEPTSVDKVVTVKQETQENELVAIKEELITDEEIDFKDLNVENCDPLKICLKDEKDDNIDLAGSSEEPPPDFKDEDFKDETTFSADPLIIDKQHDNEVNSPSSSSMLENLLVGKPSEMANKRNMQCRDGTDKKYLKENKSSIKGAAISPAFSGDTQFHHFPIKPFQKQKGQVKDRNKCEMLDDLTANSKSKQKHTTNTRHSHVKGKTSEYCRKTSMTGGVLKHLLLQTSLEKLYSGNRHEQSFEVDLPEEDNCANNQYEDCNDEDMHISTDESKHKKKLLSAGQENDDLNPTNIHTGDIFCQCPDCLKDFKTINSLQKRSKQNKTRIKLRPTCKICKKSFHRNNALEKHVENVHKGNKQVCKICCKAFNADYFQIHMKTQHSSVKPIRSYNCSKCDKSFSTKQILDKHVWDIHNNAAKVLRGSYSCDVCGKNLSSKKHLGNHKKNKHSSSKEEFICAHCDQKYKTKSSIKAHMKNVHLPPTHKCKMCDLLFNSTTTLKKHLLVQHSVGKVPSFVCETCGKAFNYKQKLEYHMTTSHSVAHKQFKCRHCEKSFFTKIHLNQHSLVHSDDRNFNCGLCDKGFKLKHHLKQHMAVHGLESIPDYRKK